MKQVDRATLEEIMRLAAYADMATLDASEALDDAKDKVGKLLSYVIRTLREGETRWASESSGMRPSASTAGMSSKASTYISEVEDARENGNA